MVSKLSTIVGIGSVLVILYGLAGGFAQEDMTGKKMRHAPAVQAVPAR